ncbi:NHL repeat-containing protein [Pseudomonas sp. LB1P83]
MLSQNDSQPLDEPGKLDFTFGAYGTRSLEGSEVKAMVVLKAEGVNQGKIIGVISTSTDMFKLFRLNKTGELDTTFGPTATGYSEDRFGAASSLSTPSGLTIIDNDQILVTGHVRDTSLAPNFPAAALFHANGSPNLVFGKFKFEESAPQANEAISSNTLQTSATDTLAVTETKNGKILISVNNSAPGPYRHWGLLIQLTMQGTLDKNLGGLGYVFFRHDNQNTSTVGVVTQADGRIILAGSTPDQGFLAGYTSTGQPDRSFGKEDGITVFKSIDGPIRLNQILLQSDDKPVAVGAISNGECGWIVRTHSNGTDDETFNGSKAVITKMSFRKLQWRSADIDSNDSIVAAGEVDARLCVVGRITKYGLVDTTFSSTGISNPNDEHTPNQTTSMGVQAGTQIIVAGRKTNEPSVSRYHG